ncbi:hypothetical protein [Micromonospora olivasterospora]|nr:hypothetical protein [Micromonospora olivasterospora]
MSCRSSVRTSGAKPVRGYYRLNSVWNFWFGLILMLFFFAYVSKHQ